MFIDNIILTSIHAAALELLSSFELSTAAVYSTYIFLTGWFFRVRPVWRLTVHSKLQIIYTANEEVARGLYNPAYKLLQMLPGPRNKGQVCMQRFHTIMQDLLQEVRSASRHLASATA